MKMKMGGMEEEKGQPRGADASNAESFAEIEERLDDQHRHLDWVADEVANLELKVFGLRDVALSLAEVRALRGWLNQGGAGPDLRPLLTRIQALEKARKGGEEDAALEALRQQVDGLEEKVDGLTAMLKGKSGWSAVIQRVNDHEESMLNMLGMIAALA